MKSIKLIIALLVLAAACAGNAWADRDHVHFGLLFDPFWDPWYYPPPPPYYPPELVEYPAPQVYIEQPPVPDVAPAAPAAADYWYYCAATKSYFPYVKECPGGWQRVSPQPPDQH